MNVLKYRVSLDMFDTHSQTTIKAKKGDSACQIYITLAKKGRLYDIGEGCSATFNARKSDGNFIYDNCTIENNTIVYDFTSSVDENGVCQVSACEGIVECEVTLYNADGKQLTSPRFTLFIDGTVYNGEEIASTPQSDFFKEIVDEAVRTKQDFFALVSQGDTLFKKILTLINHTTFDASSGLAINSEYGEISLGGKKIKFSSAELMELYANVGLFGSLTFPYGNGLINNLATPDGTNPTQAINVDFLRLTHDMQLLCNHAIAENEAGITNFHVTPPFPIDKYYIYILYPANIETSRVFSIDGMDANNTSATLAYVTTNTNVKVSVFRGEKLFGDNLANVNWDTEYSYFKPSLYQCSWQPSYKGTNLGNIVALNIGDHGGFVEGTIILIWGRKAI